MTVDTILKPWNNAKRDSYREQEHGACKLNLYNDNPYLVYCYRQICWRYIYKSMVSLKVWQDVIEAYKDVMNGYIVYGQCGGEEYHSDAYGVLRVESSSSNAPKPNPEDYKAITNYGIF